MCKIIGIQTLVPVTDTAVAYEAAPAPLAMIWELLENTVLDNKPKIREALGKSKF